MKTLLLISLFLSSAVAFSQPTLNFTPVTLSGPALSQPVDITGCGDNSGRLFIVEKRGTMRIVQNGAVLPDFFLDIEDQVMNSGERGLLGVAFHPSFPNVPYIFVNYVIDGTITNRISRFTLSDNNPNDIDESTELILIEQTGIQPNHKAGDIVFGLDGYLYFGMGDGGGGGDPSNAGQNIETLLGKMLRIDINDTDPGLNYAIPADNPFVNEDGLDEIWAIGLRNPWRISFDRGTGDFWIADVGQNLWEEVNMVPALTPGGMNFGWDCKEGNHNYEPNNCPGGTEFTWPVFEYPHSCSPCPNGFGASLSGGFVYRGNDYPVLQGCYVMADYVSNYLWIIKQSGDNPPTFDVWVQNGTGIVNQIVTFGEDDDGELYASNLAGTLYSVSATGLLPIQWENTRATRVDGGNQVDWTLFQAIGLDHFEVQRSLQSTFEDFTVVTSIQPVDGQSTYTFTDPFIHSSAVYYRIAAKMQDGSTEFSPFMRILGDPTSKPTLVYEPNTKMWRINLPEEWRNGDATLYDLQGKEIFTRRIASDKIDLNPPITPGSYFIKITGDMGSWSEQIVW
ncbi:MAG TPA: PQQ-dependent sugar dehydrogenase [Saprospiraceae bacterium]